MPESFLEPEYKPHFEAYQKNPSPEAAGNLLTAVKPVLDEALRAYGGPSAGSPTLRGKAKRVALTAFDAYDPARSKLRTHLLTRLQTLRRLGSREAAPIRVPEQVALDRRRASESEEELRDSLGREPSTTEIADHSGISHKRIAAARGVPNAFASGQFTGAAGQSQAPDVVGRGPSQAAQDTWLEIVYHDLSPADQVILEHSVGMHGRPVVENRELARMLKLSPGAVSQRKNKIQALVDSYFGVRR